MYLIIFKFEQFHLQLKSEISNIFKNFISTTLQLNKGSAEETEDK